MTKAFTVREALLVHRDNDLYEHIKTVIQILKFKGLSEEDRYAYFTEALDVPVSELEKVDLKWLGK
jgi:hypothetical protein